MKQFSFLFCFLVLYITAARAQNISTWTTNFDTAKIKVAKENKFILLNFSGSDWCGPCIKFKNDILTSPAFLKYAAGNLILVNADFPRMKKNKQDKALEQQNEKLADQYNKYGNFPYTILLSRDLKVLKVWDGYPEFTKSDYVSPPEEFISQIKEIVNAGH